MTVYAQALAPRDGVQLPAGTAVVAYHTFASDGADNPSGDDYQQAAQEQYRLVGAGSWTASAIELSGQNWISLGTLAAGNYERQVRVQSTVSGNWSAWSASAFFTVSTLNTAPAFTTPAAGASITTPTVSMTWTGAGTQKSYELQVWTGAGGTGTLEATQTVATSTRAATIALPTTGGARYLRLRYTDTNGTGSQWGERQVIAAWVAPATPTVVATPTDPGALGMLHNLAIVATHPTPSGGQPAVTAMDVFVRPNGDTSSGVKVFSDTAPTGTKDWAGPSARLYQVRVVAKAADGRSASSAWTTAVAANTIYGVLLADAADVAGTRRAYRYNDEEAVDSWSTDSALVSYAGRALPVAEFGDGEARELKVPVVHSKGTVAGDAAALVTLLRRKSAVLYRDRRGRKAYGVLEVDDVRDTFYGHVTGLRISAIDWPADRETW